jgi:hypothetical protein
MVKMGIKKMRAQSSLEYTIAIACIVAALLAMQVYVKRGLQGRLRESADNIGSQFDPKHSSSDITTGVSRNVTTEVQIEETVAGGNKVIQTTTTVTTHSAAENRHGWEAVGPLGSSLF